jgi:hypothetical protein
MTATLAVEMGRLTLPGPPAMFDPWSAPATAPWRPARLTVTRVAAPETEPVSEPRMGLGYLMASVAWFLGWLMAPRRG